jgi:hypothetical protein
VKLPLVFAVLLLCSACNRASQNSEAVRQGVVKYLAGKPGLTSVQVDVSSVTFRDNEADAVVSIRPKGSNEPGSGMSMKYTLERKGSEWVVKGKSGTGGASPHGEGMPGMGTGGEAMPPGHPATPASPPAATK